MEGGGSRTGWDLNEGEKKKKEKGWFVKRSQGGEIGGLGDTCANLNRRGEEKLSTGETRQSKRWGGGTRTGGQFLTGSQKNGREEKNKHP